MGSVGTIVTTLTESLRLQTPWCTVRVNWDRCARLPPCLLTALLAAAPAELHASAGISPLALPPAAAAALGQVPLRTAAIATADHTGTVVVPSDEPQFVAPTRRDRVGRIWAPVLIDGKGPFRLVLDTGANHSAITPATAAQLGTGHPGPDIKVAGLTGTSLVPSVTVGSMQFGDLSVGETSLPIVADVFGGAQGVLGADGFADKRIVADFRHDRLQIEQSHDQGVPRDFSSVPLRVLPSGLLAATVLVGMVPTIAIIDTGAERTVGNLALRDALRRKLRATHEEVVGVTLDVQKGDGLLTPRITLHLTTVDGLRVTYGDLYLFDYWKLTAKPTLVIGMDLLGSFDELIIDYKQHKLLLSPHYQLCSGRRSRPFACS